MRKAGTVILALLILLVHSAFAEVIRLGKTDCLLQPAAEEDTGKRYVLFAGSGDYFFAIRKCADIAAKDGMLLIPQGDSQYVLNSRASDVVIRDIRPQLLAWAEAGYEMNLVGYSSGGYPAVELARELAEEGYTGKLFILDGANRAYKSVYYNADFYREYLTSWDVTICASAGDAFRIAIQTRELGEALRDDENVTYLQYNMGHNDMKILYGYVFGGMEMPAPEEMNDLYGRKAGK